ncbi:hypothetical protein D3C81_1953970 [compost metagenome]
MSQRECAGFNWPPLAIPAEEPISVSPEAVNRAAIAVLICWPLAMRFSTTGNVASALLPSVASGVGQPARGAVSLSPIIPGRGLTWPPLIASVAVHVGQPAR